MLIATNVLRGLAMIGLFSVGDFLLLLLLLNLFVSTVTVFFAPAEAAMIPEVVPRRQLAANGVFTLTLNAAFALGFALLGPLVINIAGPQAVILVVAALYFLAAVFCWTPRRRHRRRGPRTAAARSARPRRPWNRPRRSREGFDFIRGNRQIGWSLLYLGITASLVGVLGVLGPDFAQSALGLRPKDTAIIVLPLGAGIVMGILLLNSYGKFMPRRRVIEGGLIVLGVMLALLSVAGPISQFLQNVDRAGSLLDLSAVTSLLAIVVFIAFIAGIAYSAVAIPRRPSSRKTCQRTCRPRLRRPVHAGVGLQFRADHRRRADLDLIGTATVMLIVAIGVLVSGVASVLRRDPNLGVAGPPPTRMWRTRSRRHSAPIDRRGELNVARRAAPSHRAPRIRSGARPSDPADRD